MDAPTVGILRDVTLLVWLALLAGVAAYKWIRQTRPAAAWNLSGEVNARPFITADGLVVAAISILLLSGLQKVAPAAAPTEPVAPAELSITAMFISIMFQLCICAVLLFYLRQVRNLNPLELFGFNRLNLRRIFSTAGLFMLPTFVIVMLTSAGMLHWMESFWPDMASQESVEAFRRSKDPIAKAMLVIAAAIVAPIVEETVFRGFIYGVIKRFTDSWFAGICSALLFAVVHCHIGSMVPLTVLALILCVAYEFTGSLAVPMVMHGLFNGGSIVLMILFPDMAHADAG